MDEESDVRVADIYLSSDINVNRISLKHGSVFVHDKGTSPYHNLQQLALAVSSHQPVLMCGPVGSGKTSTVEYLAFKTGHPIPSQNTDTSEDCSLFLKVQLGEQTDSKMLLGGYQCTEIPGQFVWKPGVLTQAVKKGHWLLLEDIDCTSSDVVTVIENLVKTQSLCIPGYCDNIIPHKDFQLFVTQRTHGYELDSGVKSKVFKHWNTILLKPLTSSEIVSIICKKFPKLTAIASRLVSVLDVEFSENVQARGRVPSVRDILKWCSRCEKYYEPGSLESTLRIFHDAVDIFCGFMEKELQSNAGSQIGVQLGIVEKKAVFISNKYKPNIITSEGELFAGRALLKKHVKSISVLNKSKIDVFSLNRQSCCLIEKICCCLENTEPVLLVGETGCGKTTVLQYIADTLGENLVVINMNQQSDTADLLGGFKPVSFKWVMKPFCDHFESLFRELFKAEKNIECLNKFSRLIKKENWHVLLNFITHVQKTALTEIENRLKGYANVEGMVANVDLGKWKTRYEKWKELGKLVEKYSKQRVAAEKSLIFSFVEGSLVTAMRKGYWVLLDEINLANSETLDCLSGLLEHPQESISLLEKGESRPVDRNSGFRLFAAMNPATDVGKKQLPIGLRNRFTEFYIDELDDASDLYTIVETYLRELNPAPSKLKKIVTFYLNVKTRLKNDLLNGNGKKPHFSLRNLCRALLMTSRNPCGNFSRSIYECLSVSFLTQLDSRSYEIVKDLIIKATTEGNIKTVLNQPIPEPMGGNHVNLEGFWLPLGSLTPFVPDDYILTPTVQRHLRDLIKIVSLGAGIPVLLEGDTSVGKTSLINYLAKCTGNVCSRVNNHEHTDIQEYIGTYVADSNGKLLFKEGILCDAMRRGHWLILDELNLAPSEVLEALNRVLDDNRELFIPETQEIIRAHDRFLLFATQNPTGIYGGRKELSRAFRNRFIELQFSQIPPNELVTILEKRCRLPVTYCKKMVGVMKDLQLRRRGSDIFVGKSGFITLRDLFRWGERYRKAKVTTKFHDWEQHIADEGYLLLAGRVRLHHESSLIEEVIAKYFKKRPDPNNLFSLHPNTSPTSQEILVKLTDYSDEGGEFSHIVWTYSMRRLAVLVWKALEFSEPVLIVGETGCGKTSIVQLLARIYERKLYAVNCHMHSEGADFLGGLRPVRSDSRGSGKLFEWCDGPLINAMVTGAFFLADEISLADDSVLERLNSLLEPERSILLAEKGGELLESENDEYVIVADEKFQFIGTMNPGGDYGKKELSPALRNRFTEIWADAAYKRDENFLEIIRHNLKVPLSLRDQTAKVMGDFLKWIQENEVGKRMTVSNRDVMTWVNFINSVNLDWFESAVHGIFLTFLDGLGTGSRIVCDSDSVKKFKGECLDYFGERCYQVLGKSKEDLLSIAYHVTKLVVEDGRFGIPPFYIEKGDCTVSDCNYVYMAPTTFSNTQKILRALTMKKAVLLEGSPGVGKTSIVTALARMTGHKLTRINLSDQTDISDLFGADLPEEGGEAGRFAWRDGPFLTALKEGHWILLDELNLASQSVLEGLNAVLDHRGSVYIPELNKMFELSHQTRLFGCQNPLKEGGNRRGLPSSFLNRFTQVYLESLTKGDYIIILRERFPELNDVSIKGTNCIQLMVDFTCEVSQGVSKGAVGVIGGPWEFNLRDIVRWAEGVVKDLNLGKTPELEMVTAAGRDERKVIWAVFRNMNLLFSARFRSRDDCEWVKGLFVRLFGYHSAEKVQVCKTSNFLIVGDNVTHVNDTLFYGDINEFEIFVNPKYTFGGREDKEAEEIRKLCSSYHGKRKSQVLRLLEKQYPVIRDLCHCVNMNWLPILVGDSGSGKTSCIRVLAALKGEKLRIMSCNSAMDTTEILGGFEQADLKRHLEEVSESSKVVVLSAAKYHVRKGSKKRALILLQKWMEYDALARSDDNLSGSRTYERYQSRINILRELLKTEELTNEKYLNGLSVEILLKLEKLEQSLKSGNYEAFGGKFEWVDSILVKALKEGSWLVLEDVNLCSNAVLDRLNGVLEPGGRLTIGERGAGKDGNIVSLSPHPDFRLFFCMNPANGAISRAMRNRGVEIFMSLDSDLSDWPSMDLVSLLSDLGIKDVDVQKMLIEIESKADRQSVSKLVRNGFWTFEYLKHGFPVSEAVRKSSERIYGSFEPLNLELRNGSVSRLEGGKKRTLDLSFARPEMEVEIVDPMYARLKRTCGVVHMVLSLEKVGQWSPDVEQLVFGGISGGGKISLVDLAKLNVFHMYASGSMDVLVNLKDLLKGTVLPLLNSSAVNTISKEIDVFEKMRSRIDSEVKEFPWDLRWLENVYKLFGTKYNEAANSHLILMRFALSGLDFKNESTELSSKKSLTVEEYSKCVEKGHLEDWFPDDPFVGKFLRFLTEFDRFTSDTFNAHERKVTDAEAKWFLQVMKWRFRLEGQGGLVLFSEGNKKVVQEDTLTLLILHLSWLYKAFIDEKEIIFQETNLRKKYREFLNGLKEMVFSKNYSHTLIKLCNEFRKCLGCSIPKGRLTLEEDLSSSKDINQRRMTPESEMNRTEGDEHLEPIKPDRVIIRSILNDFLQYFNFEITTFLENSRNQESGLNFMAQFNSMTNFLQEELEYLRPFFRTLKEFFRTKLKDRSKLLSEVLYFSLRMLNEDYSFGEESEPERREADLKQILPFHRPVWTCRILGMVFDEENSWTLSNYDRSRDELRDLLLTMLPNTLRPKTRTFDFSFNERGRLKFETPRVMAAIRKALKTCSLEDPFEGRLESKLSSSERNFFGRLHRLTKVLTSLNIEDDSRPDVDLGCIWILLGLVELLFLREGKVDPIRKKLIKAEYAAKEMKDAESELVALRLHSAVTGISLNHIYVKTLEGQLEIAKKKVIKYECLGKIKRNAEDFRSMTGLVEGFMTVFEDIETFCLNVVQRSFKENPVIHLCRKGRYFLIRIRTCCRELEEFSSGFRDLTFPILAALAQIENGLNLVLSELVREASGDREDIEKCINELGRYPVAIGSDILPKLKAVNWKVWGPEAVEKIDRNRRFLLLSSYLVIYNEWWYFRSEKELVRLTQMFSSVVEYWKIEEEKLREKEMEKERLYLKRGTERCKITTDEEEITTEVLKLFPTFEGEFSERISEDGSGHWEPLSENDLLQVSRLHMNVVKNGPALQWEAPDSKLGSPSLAPDHVTPLCMRLKLMSEMLPHISFMLTRETDQKLLPGLLVVMQARKSGHLSSEIKLLMDCDRGYDFYRDENVEESKKCLKILEDLGATVSLFLKEWPEHPGLLEMKKIIRKILSFSIGSPLMKFLTGLELLLKSAQDWERVAVHEVSILDHLQKITTLIIEWRKLELKGWRMCLEAAHERMKKKALKWWFHFWCLVEEFLGKKGPEEKEFYEELLKTLSNFLELSPVGEFDIRLEIILCYHRHLLHFPATRQRDNLCIALWNLHSFYHQFSSQVANKLKADSGPIFTKLNQYVKIAKWHDITYWSVKQAIDKSHRTLVKCIKEYEVLLKQKVDFLSFDHLTESPKDNVLVSASSTPNITTDSYHEAVPAPYENLLTLKKLTKKLGKARELSHAVIKTDIYSDLIFVLDELSGEICQNVEYYAKLEVDRRLPMEKRKSQAKNIVHQKRRALAELFKTLSFIGVSYRAGLTDTQFDVVNMCQAPPLTHFGDGSYSSDGEKYYLKCIARRLQLMNSLLSPSKEIEPQVIERLRGFTGHLMETNKRQRLSLIQSATGFTRLATLQKKFACLMESDPESFFLLDQKTFSKSVANMTDLLQRTSYRLQEFACLLDSWPDSATHRMKDLAYTGFDHTPAIFTASKWDDPYTVVHRKFHQLFQALNSLKNKFQAHFKTKDAFETRLRNGHPRILRHNFRFFLAADVAFFDECLVEYRNLREGLKHLMEMFESDSIDCSLIAGFQDLMGPSTSDLEYPASDALGTEERKTLEASLAKLIEKLIRSILLGIERVVKNSAAPEDSSEEVKNQPGQPLRNHLSERLVDSLANDLGHLGIRRINKVLLDIFQLLSAKVTESTSDIYRILRTAKLFLDPFFALSKYFVYRQASCYRTSGKLTSIVLKVFTAVAQKGYCAPPEYEEEEGGESGETSENKEGGGFTGNDGQGEKDVSSKIESEDQLEDARVKGSENEDEGNEDCQEEENGIEMSENFQGKPQDINNKEDVEGDEETGSEEEPDMEMGEVENGADKLDSQIWSDSSDEEEISKNDEGGGQEINQDRYAAKGEEEDDNDGDGSEKDSKKNQKNKDITDVEDAEDNEDQVDPYHGHHQPEPEPEPMDLPEDMNLDDGDPKEDENGQQENPFDIDSMKKFQLPMETDQEDEQSKDVEEKEPGSEDESEHMEVDDKEGSLGEDEQEDKQHYESDDERDDKQERAEGASEMAAKDDEQKEKPHNSDDETAPDTKPHQIPAQSAPDANDSSGQVVGTTDVETQDFQPQETFQESNMNPKGMGQAEAKGSKRANDVNASRKQNFQSGDHQTMRERKRERPGKSADDRCLADEESTFNKKLKTIDELDKNSTELTEDPSSPRHSDTYQHVSENIQNATHVLDAATKEQTQNQSIPVPEDDQPEDAPDDASQDALMDVDDQLDLTESDHRQPSRLEESQKANKNSEGEPREGIEEARHQTEGDVIQTMTVERGPETTFYSTCFELNDVEIHKLEREEVENLRQEIQRLLLLHNSQTFVTGESRRTWQLLVSVVDGLARDLCEQLRIILEPTKATRLKGDYRTGRRINMRKVIGYVASEFRKDNIWLRRTKPWKREHEIVVALDDSHSMFHNESRELAFEALAVMFRALELLEAGRLGILSFGEKTKIVHRLDEAFSVDTGARIIQEFGFEQKKTLLCDMLNLARSMMMEEKKGEEIAQLLLIISDGRGVFNEGLDAVKKAVRRATEAGIFIVFIVIDNPKSKDSIMDIRMPEFKDGKFIGMKSYMEHFPFPFYLVVRDIAMLPKTLSDALRQWFQLVHCSGS